MPCFSFLRTLLLLAGLGLITAEAQDAKPSGQVTAGSTSAISPTQGVTPVKSEKTDKILQGALTPKTRQELQAAMNAITPPLAR